LWPAAAFPQSGRDGQGAQDDPDQRRAQCEDRRPEGALHAALAGLTVPESTKILIGEVESVELEEEFAHEKLSPVLAMYKAKNFDEAVAKACRLVADGGYGPYFFAVLQCCDRTGQDRRLRCGDETCRILVNTPSSHGGLGDLYNFKLTLP